MKWQRVRLGDVIRHRKEYVTIDELQEYMRCRVQLHAKGIVLRDKVAGAEIKTKEQQVCRAGEFLVAEIDAKVGGFGIVPDDLEGAIVSSHYFLFGIDEKQLDRRFLDYFIRTPTFREQVSAQGSTNYAAIRPAHVLGYTLPLPPLLEQRRIVAKVEELAAKIDEAADLRQRSQVEREALLTASMRESLAAKRGGHATVPLESVCNDIIDCLHSNPVFSEDGIPTIRSPDVAWGRLFLQTAKRTSEEEYVRRTRRGEPQIDDIIIVREGGGTGKAGIVEEGQRFSLGQRVMMVRVDSTRVLPRFFLYQWLSPLICEDQICGGMKGSASPHLNIKATRKFAFLLPSLSEQRRIVAYLDDLQAKVDCLKALQAQTQAELDALLPSILDKAFTGEL